MEIIPVTKVAMSCMLIAVGNSPHTGRKSFRSADERGREREKDCRKVGNMHGNGNRINRNSLFVFSYVTHLLLHSFTSEK